MWDDEVHCVSTALRGTEWQLSTNVSSAMPIAHDDRFSSLPLSPGVFYLVCRRLEHRIVGMDEELEPSSPRTSVGSVRSVGEEDTRLPIHEDVGVDNIKVNCHCR
jgi:hypothetical protein